VFSGGSSVGERDLIVDAIASRGEMIFHGHRGWKPASRRVFALVKGTPFFGMPGNPTSCLSNAYILLIPYLRALARSAAAHAADDPRPSRATHRLGRRAATVLHRTACATAPAFPRSRDRRHHELCRRPTAICQSRPIRRVEEGTAVTVTLFCRVIGKSGNRVISIIHYPIPDYRYQILNYQISTAVRIRVRIPTREVGGVQVEGGRAAFVLAAELGVTAVADGEVLNRPYTMSDVADLESHARL